MMGWQGGRWSMKQRVGIKVGQGQSDLVSSSGGWANLGSRM